MIQPRILVVQYPLPDDNDVPSEPTVIRCDFRGVGTDHLVGRFDMKYVLLRFGGAEYVDMRVLNPHPDPQIMAYLRSRVRKPQET